MITTTRPSGGFTQQEWDAALGWDAYLASLTTKQDVWDANARRAAVHEEEAARLRALPGARRVLVLTEDWCGDAARSVPVISKAAELTDDLEVRYLPSDEHPDVIARYLSHGGRAIPIAIVQDEHGAELGAWGPRPAPLQALMRQRRAALGAPDASSMGEFYAPIMAWYAKDGGRTILQELLVLLERGGTPR